MSAIFLSYLKAFVVGGLICLVGQLLIDFTKLTPARILVAFVVAGVFLSGLGLYQPLIDFAGTGGHRSFDRLRRHHRTRSAGRGAGIRLYGNPARTADRQRRGDHRRHDRGPDRFSGIQIGG